MSLKRSLSVSSASFPTDSDRSLKQMKSSSELSFCQVCGDKASIINYGALSCQSCKSFFRRNGFRLQNVGLCLYKRSCEINIETRRDCTACRLAKCLSVGMSSYLIRKQVQEKRKCLLTTNTSNNQHVVYKQLKNTSRLPTLNPLQNNRLSLRGSEWTLLSNVIHAYDTYSSIPQIRRAIEELATSYNVSNVFETIVFMYKSMESFIRSSPDFRILTINEQQSLFERNLHGITALCLAVFFRTTDIIDNPKCVEAFSLVYGSEMMLQAKRIVKQLDLDLTIIKLMTIILAFSSNCFIIHQNKSLQSDSLLNGIFRLLGSQNVYVELLWKYMIYQYGYHGTVLRFFRLIVTFLELIKYSSVIYTNNETHHDLVENICEQIKQSLITEQNKQGLLWGKI